ncbi:G-type lectin S-receptor-like serine/threonine-protein kinase LECRK2 [Mercurialis annua]|uniref:G-type lectin S-receptor-like serine/threonine-protein kinase LECRK2 n=1 Tax=Mercurialis annua TaxID=3986 RepID=UPI00215DF9D0|nr:G-type lectin S-receptor-like serine/threonine-protein kinase LECRK2 [Mercurialis annua]
MATTKFLSFLVILTNLYSLLHAQIPQNISLGSGITAGTNVTWRSISGEFAFGFYPLHNNLYLMGIWFDKIPEKTLIWSANRNSPAEPGSTIRLTFAGQLFLTYSNGTVRPVYNGAAAGLGFMQNDGNFVLRDDSSRIVWQSFDSPTDSLVPGQVLRNGQKIYSNVKGSSDYSVGNFMLEMQYDGNLVLSAYKFSDPGYWYTGTLVGNVSLVFNPDASLYLVNSTNDEIYSLRTNFSAPVGEFYYRATIDDRGNFRHFVYRKSNGTRWASVWQAVDEPCFVNSVCGVNGFCTSPDNKTVNCGCIPGYVPLDRDDVSKGCRPETVVNYCADASVRNFEVQVIDDADFPFEGFADLSRVLNVDEEGCKEALMNDCYSLAASLIDSRCNKKRAPLLNARKSASTKGRKAFVKVPMKISNPEIPKDSKENDFNVGAFLKISLIVSVVFASVFGATAFYYHPTSRRLFIRGGYSSNTNTIGINFREFNYSELHEATNGFSRTLGRGSSAKVYGGTLRFKDVQIDIAVKKLVKDIEKSDEEFRAELKIIGRTHHKNLVRLLGFCAENNQRLLVFELMANGSLSNLLFGEGVKARWNLRAELVLGIARGL